MSNIVSFGLKASEFAKGVASGGGGGDNGDMDARVTKLESFAEKTGERFNALELRLARIESKLDHLEKDSVTKDGMKASISDAKNSIIMWVVGAVLTFGTTISAVVFFIARNVH